MARPNCWATSRAAASLRCVVHTCTRLTLAPAGALPASPLRKPRARSAPSVSPASPDRVPALNTLTCTWWARIRWPFLMLVVLQPAVALDESPGSGLNSASRP